MSTNLSPAFVQLFEAEVHQAYQGAAVLRGAARVRLHPAAHRHTRLRGGRHGGTRHAASGGHSPADGGHAGGGAVGVFPLGGAHSAR